MENKRGKNMNDINNKLDDLVREFNKNCLEIAKRHIENAIDELEKQKKDKDEILF